MARPGPTSPKRLADLERRGEALRLRKLGKSFVDIAAELGYNSRQAAHSAVTNELAAIRAEMADTADDLRTLEAERLDQLWIIARANAARDGGDMRAIDTALRIMDRRAKLFGLDKADERMAQAIEANAEATTAQARVLFTIIQAAMARADLTPDQQQQMLTAVLGEIETNLHVTELEPSSTSPLEHDDAE